MVELMLVVGVAAIVGLINRRWMKSREVMASVLAAVVAYGGTVAAAAWSRRAAHPDVKPRTSIKGNEIAISLEFGETVPDRVVLDYVPKCWIVAFEDKNQAASGRTTALFQGRPRPPFTENRLELEVSSPQPRAVLTYSLTCIPTGAPFGTGHEEDDRYLLAYQWKYDQQTISEEEARYYFDDSVAPPRELQFSVGELHAAVGPTSPEPLDKHTIEQHVSDMGKGAWLLPSVGELSFTYSVELRSNRGTRSANAFLYPLGSREGWPARPRSDRQ